MVLQEKHILTKLNAPTRLSDLKAGTFTTIQSRKAFKKYINKGLVKIDGEMAKTSIFAKGGEVIEIFRDISISKKPQITIDFEILFEDDYIAIINKPAGIEVSGNKKYTITNALSNALSPSSQKDALYSPLPAHRLDYPTSGCLAIGKTTSALTALNQLFENKIIDKTYLAITIGKQQLEGSINLPIDLKESQSKYQVLKTIPSLKYENLNLVALKPLTGRRHQLRKHLIHLGNPIFGEKQYGNPNKQGHGNGLYLQAYQLIFIHPITKVEIKVNSPVSKKFSKIFPNINAILKEASL